MNKNTQKQTYLFIFKKKSSQVHGQLSGSAMLSIKVIVNLDVLAHTLVARANAYSATTVFPAEVCAATNTESPFSR